MSPWIPRLFRSCAIYGVLALIPLYFLPWPALRTETYLGFVGLALVFQGVLWLIAADPVRYRQLMLAAAAEKLAFALPALGLYAQGRTGASTALFAAIDLVMGGAFALAFVATPTSRPQDPRA